MGSSWRLLFDQNVPAPLARLLPGHDVTTANALGWAALANGLLIAAAEQAGFEVLVTADKNIRYQQNLTGRRIGIVVISTQNLAALSQGRALLEAAILAAGGGACHEVDLPRPLLLRRPPP